MDFGSKRNSMKDSCLDFQEQEGREKSQSLYHNETNQSREFFNENDENMKDDDNGNL